MALSGSHTVNDTGHVSDHNLIDAAIADLQTRMSAAESTIVSHTSSISALSAPTLYETGNASELVSTIPVATTAGGATKQVIFSQYVGDIATGQFIVALTEYEVTNDLAGNVMIASTVILADSASATTGTEIAEANSFNVSTNMHHGVPVKVATFKATSDLTAKYVNVVAYATWASASGGDTLTVEQDYGRLSVVKF